MPGCPDCGSFDQLVKYQAPGTWECICEQCGTRWIDAVTANVEASV